MMSNELIKVKDTESLITKLDKAREQVVTATDDQLTMLYGQLKPLEKSIEQFNKDVRTQFINRRENGSLDSNGNRYFAADGYAVKLTRRATVKLEPNAAEILEEEGVLDLMPREFDPAKAEAVLKELGVDMELYTTPSVTKATLESALDMKLVSEEVAMRCLSPESITWAVAPHAVDKLPG